MILISSTQPHCAMLQVWEDVRKSDPVKTDTTGPIGTTDKCASLTGWSRCTSAMTAQRSVCMA